MGPRHVGFDEIRISPAVGAAGSGSPDPESLTSMYACTIVARNYLPYARVLARSFRQHHPEVRFSALVIDLTAEEAASLDEDFRVLSPYDLLPDRDVHELAMCYDIVEFATSLKPFLLRHLLDEGARSVIYFDPDIQLFARIDDIWTLAERTSVVLTPHSLAPLPNDGSTPDEPYILRAGIYNLGFIAVGERAMDFLRWWSDRLRRDCVNAPDHGLFVDQRWVDLVPAYFDHTVLRDPGCNVAYWNLGVRDVKRKGDAFEVDGQPLRFFHFSGYDPRQPDVLSKHQGRAPRVLLRDLPVVRELCDRYAASLDREGYREASATNYAYASLPNGTPIDHPMRRGYRLALKASDLGRGPRPPDPFIDPEAYSHWWSSERLSVMRGDDLDAIYPPDFRLLLGAIARRPRLWRAIVGPSVGAYRRSKKLRSILQTKRGPQS